MRKVVVLLAALWCAACGSGELPVKEMQSDYCGVRTSDVRTVELDGVAVYTGALRDYQPMDCESPIESCGPWSATITCKFVDGFERQTWFLHGTDGDVTWELETREGVTYRELMLSVVASPGSSSAQAR